MLSSVKKAERQRIDAFELWCWRRLLRVPWTARRSIQSILKEISPGCSLEGLMLKLKFQYFGHLMWKTDSLEKTLMLGKIEGWRKRGLQRMRWLDDITNSVGMNLGKLWGRWWRTGKPSVLPSMGSQTVRHELNNVSQTWTTTKLIYWICTKWEYRLAFYICYRFHDNLKFNSPSSLYMFSEFLAI